MTITTRSLTKKYLLKTALDAVSVEFAGGKIHALVGENGAGKSTLAALISGDLQPTSGEIFLDGKPVHFSSPKDALKAGIVLVHQRPLLASALTAKENIVLQLQSTRERQPFFLRSPTRSMLTLQKMWSPALNLNAHVIDMGGNLRFYTALLGALLQQPKTLFLDEPSAFLDMDERARLYQNLRALAGTGTNIIVITHSMAEAENYADTVTRLQKGTVMYSAIQQDTEDIKDSEDNDKKSRSSPSKETSATSIRTHLCSSPFIPMNSASAFRLEHVSSRPKNRPALLDATIDVRFGEITAVTGLQEAAMDTLEDVVTGMNTASAKGFVKLMDIQQDTEDIKDSEDNDKEKKFSASSCIPSIPMNTHSSAPPFPASKLNPRILREHGAAIVPSDRNFRAANPKITVEQLLSVYTKTDTRENAAALIAKAEVNITPEQSVSHLSGGMLQRLILARELSVRPRLLILCNPMQGLDIQAQGNVCQTLTNLARQGTAVLIVGAQDFPLTLAQKVYRLESGRTELIFENAMNRTEAEQ